MAVLYFQRNLAGVLGSQSFTDKFDYTSLYLMVNYFLIWLANMIVAEYLMGKYTTKHESCYYICTQSQNLVYDVIFILFYMQLDLISPVNFVIIWLLESNLEVNQLASEAVEPEKHVDILVFTQATNQIALSTVQFILKYIGTSFSNIHFTYGLLQSFIGMSCCCQKVRGPRDKMNKSHLGQNERALKTSTMHL